MFKRHCSDERLLALLDAKPGDASRRIITRHLQSCWKCWERLCELENEHQSGAWGDRGLVSSREVEIARTRFLAWTRTQAFEFPRDMRFGMRLPAVFRAPAMAAVGAFLLIGGVTVWHLQVDKPEQPQALKQALPGSGPRPIDRAQPRTQPLKEVARLDHATLAVELPVPQPPGPTVAQLLETEVEVWWLLHRAGACHGEPIEVTRHGDHIVVHGLVASRKRRRELAAILKDEINSQLIRIELRTAEDLAAENKTLASAASAPQLSSPQNRDNGFRRAVAAAVRDAYPLDTAEEARHRLVGLANRAIRRAEDAIAEAWAIRRIGERFHGERNVNLSVQSRRLIESMVKEHLEVLHSHATELHSFLSPILFRIAPEQHSLATPLDLFATVERLRLLVQTSLAGDSSPLGSPAEVSGEIASLSQFLSDDLADIDVVLARMFPEP
jgi:hypothetical protein